MKRRKWMVTGAAAVAIVCAYFALRPSHRELDALEKTRRELRQQGFKIDLAEFDFSTSPEMRTRVAALTNADAAVRGFSGGAAAQHYRIFQNNKPDLMAGAGSNSAIVVWKEDKLSGRNGENVWALFRDVMQEHRTSLDAARDAALSGPIRFELDASHGTGMLLPHLASLRGLTEILTQRVVFDLHEGQTEMAWKDLLAGTRLVTAWEPEPVDVSRMVRYACTVPVLEATWEALQAQGWSDEQLAGLQQEWESAEFFKGLPEAAAFNRAGYAAACEQERNEPRNTGLTLSQIAQHPIDSYAQLKDFWERSRYFRHGTYEDEKALLLHFRDRELEIRRAAQVSTWSEMRGMPGVTIYVPFRSKYSSRVTMLMNLKQMGMGASLGGQTVMARAAEAETRRRLIVTAVALERYRGRHGSYPKTVQELVPEFLKTAPVDFMDGKLLRYRVGNDGRFVLYSTGLDCIDDGGMMAGSQMNGAQRGSGVIGQQARMDLVWPRAASPAVTVR